MKFNTAPAEQAHTTALGGAVKHTFLKTFRIYVRIFPPEVQIVHLSASSLA